MAYSKTTWVTGTTPISAANLNNLETQYDEATAYADTLVADLIPSGLVCMWDGLLANIPDGWVLCDGTNGTEDRINNYPIGIPDGTTNPGDSIGSKVKTTSGHNHNHASASTGEDGAHTHTISRTDSESLSRTLIEQGTSGSSINAVTQESHDHSNDPTAEDGSHDHSVPVNQSSTDTIIDIRPPSLTTAFIMKT